MPPKGKKPKATEAPRPSPPTTAPSTSISTPSINTAHSRGTNSQAPSCSSSSSTKATITTTTTRELAESSSSARQLSQSSPYDDASFRAGGTPPLSSLSKTEQVAWLSARVARRLAVHPAGGGVGSVGVGGFGSGGGIVAAPGWGLSGFAPGSKSFKEVWKVVNELGLPLRVARSRSTLGEQDRGRDHDQRARGVGIRTGVEGEFERRTQGKVRLLCLGVESRRFRLLRAQGKVAESEVWEEKSRRKEMAALRKELYGGGVGKEGRLSLDPEWDDVVPIVLQEPEKALAAIAYPHDYAEAMAYLRAVMQAKEYSPRCLRLTEHIIGMNPAHYTVWLYRAANVFALKLPLLDEIKWLNGVAFENLKNYQIWHHRHLLVENYYPSIADDADAIAQFAASEREFLQQILAEDTKNYHVWSYRSYLVGKLGVWGSEEERRAIEAMIDDDVRNNSAWSHRFFLVFSDPAHATPGAGATEPDPKVPQAIIDREVEYAKAKIPLAPQNQSGWNYLRGVLVKGARRLASVEDFVSDFVKGLGEGEDTEDVQSTHALDLLAEIYAENGDKDKADLALRRLGQKWDRIRIGYWEWRRKCLEVNA